MNGLQKAVVAGVLVVLFVSGLVVALHMRAEQPPTRIGASLAQVPGTPAAPPAVSEGEKLGLAVIRNEPGAMDKLAATAKAEFQTFNSNQVGLDEGHKGELAHATFTPLRIAFEVITIAATNKNQVALNALAKAFTIPDLKGMTVRSLGFLAADGDQKSLDVLIHPDKYGVLLSTAVGSLKPAANKGNQKAIDFLVSVTKSQKDKPLWFLAVDGLRGAAAAGNAAAVDVMIGFVNDKNPNFKREAIAGLKQAAANNNAKAAQALKSAGVQ